MQQPPSKAAVSEQGWNTFWVGKNHNTPVDEWAMGGTKRNWPLARGFDRFYGFIGGETNQWYPTLVEDNHYVEQPYQPEDGYHLSKDLADTAMGSSVTPSSRTRARRGSCGSAQLVDLWFVEAGKYDVLPLDDRTVAELALSMPEAIIPPGGTWKY